MRRLALVLVCAAFASGAQAQQRPFTPRMTCAQAQQTVFARGAIVLGTGTYTYERFVRDSNFCEFNEYTDPGYVPTRDTPQCFVGYVCRSGPRELFGD